MMILLLLFLQYHALAEVIHFQDEVSIYADKRLVNTLTYNITVRNNYSNWFIVYGSMDKFHRLCSYNCSALEIIKSVLKNVTIISKGDSTLNYTLNVTYDDYQYNPDILIVVSVICGLIGVIILSILIWYILQDKYC